MSKATFYEHFANKEECILALFDTAAEDLRATVRDSPLTDGATPEERIRGGIHAFLAGLAAYPDQARTLLVEIIGAGPRAAERRDAVLEAFTDLIEGLNARAHDVYGAPRLRSREDAFAIVGAIVELASRQLRHDRPERIEDLEPVIERLVRGVLGAQPE
jgi:AcrR family transcriptional regulator